MKKLIEMQPKEALEVICKSVTLSQKLYEEIYYTEIDCGILDDRIGCFERGSISYEIGTSCYCYLKVEDEDLFLEGVAESVNYFGGSPKLERLLAQTQKLRYTNLFSYMVEKLANLYLEEEIMHTITFVEEMGYAIYSEDTENETLLEYMETFLDSYGEDYFLDEDGKLWRVAEKVA